MTPINRNTQQTNLYCVGAGFASLLDAFICILSLGFYFGEARYELAKRRAKRVSASKEIS